MPIKRFADDLLVQGEYRSYMQLLTNSFNARTVDGLMCRDTVNVAWDGSLYDCDFNAALAIHNRDGSNRELYIWNIGEYAPLLFLQGASNPSIFMQTASVI
jgi:hypothetical protein